MLYRCGKGIYEINIIVTLVKPYIVVNTKTVTVSGVAKKSNPVMFILHSATLAGTLLQLLSHS